MAKRRKKPRAGSQKPKPLLPAETEAKRGRGRPSALEGVNLELFYGELEIGTPFTAAAPLAGMNRSTLYAVIKSGKRLEKEGKKGPARDFLDRFRLARAKGESHYVKVVASGAAGDRGAPSVQKCPHCSKPIELEVPRQPRAPDTRDAMFMLKAINPKVWNVDKAPTASTERPISRLELMGAFAQMGQAVAQEVEDPRARARIGERWREIYRTLGLDENRVQIAEKEKQPLDQKRLTDGKQGSPA